MYRTYRLASILVDLSSGLGNFFGQTFKPQDAKPFVDWRCSANELERIDLRIKQ